MTRSYPHGELVTCTFKSLKSNFYIEITYKESELVMTEMWSKDWEKVNPDTIPMLAQFLNANNL